MNLQFPTARRVSRGFTLVELLVASSILMVLSAVGFSVGKSGITRARIVQSTANLRSLATANTSYLADYGTFCPADDRTNLLRWHGARTSTSSPFDATKGFLSPYLGSSQRVGICPLLKAMVKDSSSFEEGTGGYGYNSTYVGGRPGGGYDSKTKWRVPARAANLTDPSQTVMFATTAYAREDGVQEYPYCEPPFWDTGSGPSPNRPNATVHFRADGKALVAWCDGRVTAEARNSSKSSTNPHGGNDDDWNLGWFGPEEQNGYWNPDFIR